MCYNFYLFLIPRAMYFVPNKSHMFVRLNLVANLMYIREVKIDVYGRPVTANAKLQVGFSGEVLAVRN